MNIVHIQIVRFVEPHQPGIVECVLTDAWDRQWKFMGKAPYFSEANLDEDSSYPQSGILSCEVIREWTDQAGRSIITIDTEKPLDIAATTGETRFDVLAHHITKDVA